MKKIAVILFSVLLVISATACGRETNTDEERTPDIGNTTETASTENDSAENILTEAASEPESEEGMPETAAENGKADDEAESEAANEAEETKILVAYFSATNTTEGVAEMIAGSLSADIYEIIPEQPYTDDDLNYHDDNSRSTIEMNDSSARPAISGSVEDMEQYDIVFIGFPIWWGQAPRIVSTFMESYSFEGKTVIPFCTSASSGLGSSGKDLEELTDGAQWLEGKRFGGGVSEADVRAWIEELDL